jgi:hypothetical protein
MHALKKTSIARRAAIRQKLKIMKKNRIKEWKEFLKDDVDFDYNYVLKVLRYKLFRLRTHIVTHRMITDAPKVAKEIKEVLDLLDRVIEDKHEERAIDAFLEKHGLKEIGGRCNEEGEWESNLPSEFNSEYLKAISDGNEARREDLKQAFALMAENIWGWWD